MSRRATRWTLAGLAALFLVPLAVIAADMGEQQGQGGMMAGKKEMMEKMGMDEGMMMRMKVMMSHEMDAYDPAGILALREDLKLTDDQVQQIEAMIKDAADKTRSLLTEEQQKMLEPMEGTPKTMKEIHTQMMEKMKKEHPEMMMYTCPMHPEVKQQGEGKCPKCGMNLEPMGCPMCMMKGMMEGHKGMMHEGGNMKHEGNMHGEKTGGADNDKGVGGRVKQ